VTGHDLRLPVERHMFGMFGHGDMRQHRLGRPTALQKVPRCLGLNNPGTPLGTGVFRADRHNDPILGWHHVDPFAAVFANTHHIATTARAGDYLGFDHALNPWQVLGQHPWLARFAGRLLFRIVQIVDLFFNLCDFFLRFSDGGLDILQRQLQCIRPVEALSQAFSACQFHGMRSSMRLIL